MINSYYTQLNDLKNDLIIEMSKLFYDDTANEFIQTYIDPDLDFLQNFYKAGNKLLLKKYFSKRPFVNTTSDENVSLT